MKEEDKEAMLPGRQEGSETTSNKQHDDDVVHDENIPVVLIDTTPDQEQP